MKHFLFLLGFPLFLSGLVFGQDGTKVFFDRAGKGADESSAYYYRQLVSPPNGYKSFFVNGGGLYFEGSILTPNNSDEELNKYTGTCTWYYKNGKRKAVRTFNFDGLENGTSNYYFESGKIWKEIAFLNGKMVNNSLKEYDEEGRIAQIFTDAFNDNSNDWDLYTSDKTSAVITGGNLSLVSFTKEGASRYISVPSVSEEFALEADIDIAKLNTEKGGLVFGFKDWQNYNFFLITQSSFYIGTVFEGVSSIRAEGMFSPDIKKSGLNTIKIISIGEKNIYSINGSIQYNTDRSRNFGSNIGFVVSGKSGMNVDKLIYKNMDVRSGGGMDSPQSNDMNVKASGSGLIISTDGYIITNYHVIETANTIQVEVKTGGISQTYHAIVVQKDVDNDLAVLKIKDDAFKPMSPLQYSFKESGGLDVGAGVFTIGFPYALTGMGKEAKFTDGKVSAKTGYNSAVNSYQTSIPVQPGNSGGPLFSDKGQLVGLINAKIADADNVSYAIKLNYIKNLIELLPDTPEFPNSQAIVNSTLEEKIKVLTSYVVLIKIK